ncbi:MAG: metallophosphoesterase [Pseudomonadota bacterium]
MRIFALSDIHADYKENLAWVHNLSSADYADATLILAGDLSHDRNIFAETLTCLRKKFARVFFVPGNHDLWVRSTEAEDSLTKHAAIMRLCRELGVHTCPAKVAGSSTGAGVWIVPLESWYVKPEESETSLFVTKKGEDPSLRMWVDDRATRWPGLGRGMSVAQHFFTCNKQHLSRQYDGPVISFSHFLPRRELIFSTREELISEGIPLIDPQPRFNFSRVAGSSVLDEQLRSIGSAMHVYGHQHRNRCRRIDGVTYISHCLGYPRERSERRISGALEQPRLIWDRDAA